MNKLKLKYSLAIFSLIMLFPVSISSEEEWVVNDIRISGLQRVSAGSIFNVMPIAVGDTVDTFELQDTAKTIFKTGQFDDIEIGREGNTLIISIVERPSIASIELDGNKALKTEDLMKGLNDAGLSEGQVYKRSIVNGLALEIQRQYVAQGRYGAKVDVSTEPEPRNRVSLDNEIDEGEVAEIKNINSFRFVENAINYEVDRQKDILESGEAVNQETRLYDSDIDETRSLRSKEEANDYRYFPDPDLLPVIIDEEYINEIRESLPELPSALSLIHI